MKRKIVIDPKPGLAYKVAIKDNFGPRLVGAAFFLRLATTASGKAGSKPFREKAIFDGLQSDRDCDRAFMGSPSVPDEASNCAHGED